MFEPTGAVVSTSSVLSPKSRWSAEQTVAFLRDSCFPLRVSSVSAKGYPHITSLWFRFIAGRFWCCTQQRAVVCRQVLRDPRVGFEVAVNDPPYFGVRGQGDAEIVQADATELLNELCDRYLGDSNARLKAWLLSRIATEAMIAITPRRLTSWDFRRRMSAPD